jgi:hypothetical protein
MDKITALFNEYNNLWQEKLIHKQSIRKFHYYITYLTTMGSLALTIIGVSLTDVFKNSANQYLNPSEIATLLIIPLTPVILVIVSFAINDLFQIYVMGEQIGIIEEKINNIYGNYSLLSWQHKVCPFIYDATKEKAKKAGINYIKNIIKLNDFWILIPFVILICLSAIIIGIFFIYDKFKYLGLNYQLKISWNIIIIIGYLLINAYLFFATLIIGIKLFSYTKTDGSLKKTMIKLHQTIYD